MDIFSFALVLHQVVTGRKLFASIVNKRDQLQMIYNSDLPQLSQALAESLDDNRPQSPLGSTDLLESGKHPAARRNVITSCHSVCMQQLMEDCLSLNPSDRPTARGICSRLLLCAGDLPQVNFFMMAPVTQAVYSPAEKVVVTMSDSPDELNLIIPGKWHTEYLSIPYREKICLLACIDGEVFLASEDSNLIFSLRLPFLTSGHISHQPLPGKPLCIFPHSSSDGVRIVVGMTSGRIAVFSTPRDGRHPLESEPFITQVLNHPDPQKTAITCGVYHRKVVWCGCGRYLIGMDTKNYLLKYYKPMIKDHANVSHIAAAAGRIWLAFEQKEELVVCDTNSDLRCNPISCQ